MAINSIDVINIPLSVQPVPFESLCDRYSINLQNGIIYDFDEYEEIIPTKREEDDEYIVTLITNKDKEVIYSVGDILIQGIYGYTNSSYRPKIKEIPCNSIFISPQINKLIRLSEDEMEINDIKYRKWNNTEYFVSEYGTVFSIPMGGFLRRYYNEKGYATVHFTSNGVKKSYRVHRMVWETYVGPIPDDKEIDHMNSRRWDNRIGNIQLLTYLENLQKSNPSKYRKDSDDIIILIGTDLLNGVPTKCISEKYNIPRYKVWAIKYRGLHEEVLRKAGIDLSNVQKDPRSLITRDDIPIIFKMKKDGIPVETIADKYDVSVGHIRNILSRQVYKDIEIA